MEFKHAIRPYQSEIAFSGVVFYLFTFGLIHAIDYSLLVLAITSLILVLTDSEQYALNFFNGYIVNFFMAIVISNYFGIYPSRSANLLLALLPALLLYYVISHYFSHTYLSHLAIALTVFSLFMASYLLLIAFHYPQKTPSFWMTKTPFNYLIAPNSILFILLLSPFSFVLLNSPKKYLNILAANSLLLSLTLTIIYQSRSALLLFLFSIMGMGLFFGHLKKVGLFMIGLLIAIIGIDALTHYALFTKLIAHSWTTRLPLWLAAYYLFLTAPLLGHGSGSYLLLYRHSLEQHHALYLLNQDPRITPWAHNLYLEILAEHGLIGLGLWLILLAYYFKKVRRLLTKNPEIAQCIFVALIGFYGVAVFELSLWQQWVLTLLFIFFAIIDRLEVLSDLH